MRVFLIITALLFTLNSNGQKVDCSTQTKAYEDFLKVNNFEEAYSYWEFVKDKCPKQSDTIYLDGIKIIQYKIDTAKNEDEKLELVRQLLSLYDQFYKHFPKSIENYQIKKAMVLIDNSIDSKDEIFQLLDNGFNSSLSSETSAKAIFNYFKLLTEKNQNGDHSIPNEKIIEQYTLLSNRINELFVQNPSEKDSYVAARRALNALAESYLNCENLINFYQNRIEKNQENEVWLQNSLSVLSEKCSAEPIFLSIAEKLYAMKASSQSAYFLAVAKLKNRKMDDSKKLFVESAELETSSIEKASKYYTLATGLFSSDKSKAKEYLLKSVSFDPKLGKSYLFLAELYANSADDCGKNDFEKKAIYYLAIQTIKKAAVADKKYNANVERFEKEYSKKSLSSSDIAKAKMNGKTMTIDCWINEKITLPAK